MCEDLAKPHSVTGVWSNSPGTDKPLSVPDLEGHCKAWTPEAAGRRGACSQLMHCTPGRGLEHL